MSDQITTKPGDKYASIKQPAVYEALRRQGYSKESAARISNARKRKRTKMCLACTLASVKEQLSPGVTRIRGNLCNVHGRWGRCPGASSAAPSKRVAPKKLPAAPRPKAGGRKRAAAGGKKGAKPKQTPEQRAARRQAEQAKQQETNRQSVIDEMTAGDVGLQPGAAKALLSFADGKEDPFYTDGLVKAGLMERGLDGTPRLTSAGSAAVSAINHGNTRAALDAIGRGQDRATRAAERQAAADKKRAEQEKKKKGGGGKGKKEPKPEKQARALLPRTSTAPRPVVGGGGGRTARQPQPAKPALPKALTDAAQALSEGQPIDDATAALLIRNGLARYNKDRVLVLTAAGQRAARTTEKASSFAVFKGAKGAWRWIARTTTAYRDRDGEIISTKALEDDAQRMTATAQYGPLRYWHVGQPDPFSVDQPWGPGLDIGDCDFSTVIGRTSLESGTFKSEALGRAFASDAAQHELSPGFFHAPTEPDAATGVFHHIRRFERSVVPTKHGRASNLFTGLTVKEHRMDQHTYDQRVKAYLDFAREQGIPPEEAAAPIAAIEQADKEATAKQIAYKEEKPPQGFTAMLRAFLAPEQATTKDVEAAVEPPAPPPDPLAPLKEEIAALRAELSTLKAAPPPFPPAEAETETQADGMAMEEAGGEMMDEGGGGITLSAEDLTAIGQVIGAALEPLIGALAITSKLESGLGELKTAMAGYTKTKDDTEAQRATEIAALKTAIDQQQAKLAELLDDKPRGAFADRPTNWTENTALGVLAAIKNGPPEGGPQPNTIEELTAQWFPEFFK